MNQRYESLGTYGISRVDRIRKDNNREEHYWFVRIWGNGRNPKKQKTFYDNIYGGKIFSLAEAVKFRDQNISDRDRLFLRKPYLENYHIEQGKTSVGERENWQKERIRRRLDTIEKLGNNKIYLGYGRDAAMKAREYGASKVTCWKIKSGQQNYYTVGCYIPSIIGKMCKPMTWTDRDSKSYADIEKQKEFGKKKYILGTGLSAANEAKKMGASARTCYTLLRGKKNFFTCCATLPSFEVNGFIQEITPSIMEKIKGKALNMVRDKNLALDVAAEIMLLFSSMQKPVTNLDGWIASVVKKYKRALESDRSFFNGKTIRLDIDGDIERFDKDSRNEKMNGRWIYFKGEIDSFPINRSYITEGLKS